MVVRTYRAPPPANPRFAAGGLQSVGAATIAPGNIRVIVNALGTVTPLATVTVQTQISGQSDQVGFTEGQLVNKGDFLAQIDERPYEIAKAQAEGQLAHDQGLLGAGANRPQALSEALGAEFDRAPAGRRSGLPGPASTKAP